MSTTSLPFTAVRYALYAVAVPIALLLLAGTWFILSAARTMLDVHVTGTDRYTHLPRPAHKNTNTAIILGDWGEIRASPPGVAYARWAKELKSNVYIYRGLFYSPSVWLCDPVALNHILVDNSYDFPKPAGLRDFLESLLGAGLFIAEGEAHKRQRKICQPAFSVSALRDLTPVFFKHANRLTNILTAFVDRATQSETPQIVYQSPHAAQISRKGAPVVDISAWLGRTTLDVIGESVFAHNFGSIDELEGTGRADEVASAYKDLLKATSNPTLGHFLQFSISNIPGFLWVRSIPTKRQAAVNRTLKIVQATSQKIIEKKRSIIKDEMTKATRGTDKETLSLSKAQLEEAGLSGTRDLLHLVLRANMALDAKPSECLSDAELLGQLTTFIFAGHETTEAQLSFGC